jgi:diguanylate cyclase (GGDEF)-like protein
MKHKLVAAAPPAPLASLESIELLLVNEDPGDADLIRGALSDPEATAFHITRVEGLDDAGKQLDRNHYHVMLLDLSSPGGRGLEALRRARAAAPILPIIVMVDPGDEDLVLEAVKAGAQDYLIKGAQDSRSLARAVHHAIERQRILITTRHSRAREHYLATHDVLTGLPNRHLFLDHVTQALSHARRHRSMLAILFLDIDHFKSINDSEGHAGGDLLIRLFARRLTECLRHEDAVARLGGDEFTVMQSDVSSLDQVGTVVQKALGAVARPYMLSHGERSITSSVGVAVYPGDGVDVDTLLRNADAAMYSAKKQGRNRYQFYAPGMGTPSSR